MSKSDRKEKGRVRKEAERARKETESIIKKLNLGEGAKNDKRGYFKNKRGNGQI